MSVQAGMEYPNVVRVLKPVGTDNNSEYYWYNTGNPYPWPGAVFPDSDTVIFGSDTILFGTDKVVF